MQRKSGLFFTTAIFLGFGLYMGCHSGPPHQTASDAGYRAIERDADRNSADLAVTGANIAAGVERIDSHAGRVASELDSLGAAISGSSLGDMEKSALLRQVAVAREEAAALRSEADILRRDTGRLNTQLAEQREISVALSAEHDKREVAAAAVRIELEGTKEELAKAEGQRNAFRAILITAGVVAALFMVFKALRAIKIVPI